MKKLKAFTTMELSIVMLMAGLISSLAYGGYSLFVKQFYTYTKTTDEAMDIRHLFDLLKRDIDGCKVLYGYGDLLECENGTKTVQYDFENENYVLRSQSTRTDTFPLVQKDRLFSFQGQVAGNSKTVIDELHFTSLFKKTEIVTQFKKQYSNKDLMEFHLQYGH